MNSKAHSRKGIRKAIDLSVGNDGRMSWLKGPFKIAREHHYLAGNS